MKILITGLMTLHWGRLEYGNIGNFYIVDAVFSELRRVFPDAEITTTFQMTDEFLQKYKLTTLPMQTYYAWTGDDLDNALKEFALATYYSTTKKLIETTSYIKALEDCDLVIDLSGDMWGDYAEHVGENRFLVNLLKMRTAQLLGKKTVLFAGSQGPFEEDKTAQFAKLVYENYTAVLAREPQALENVKNYGFSLDNSKLFACPAFLFEPAKSKEIEQALMLENIQIKEGESLVGVTICGFNMETQPYDKDPREDSEFDKWVEVIEYAYTQTKAKFLFISHSHGFELPPHFKKIQGRDYPILKQLQTILLKRNIIPKEHLLILEEVHSPDLLKGIISTLDMMITGRVHASVAASSQCVPTVFIPYIASMKSTKILGFASLLNMQDYVALEKEDIKKAIVNCWKNKEDIRKELEVNVEQTKEKARNAFAYLKRI